jgi:hypothetical protein
LSDVSFYWYPTNVNVEACTPGLAFGEKDIGHPVITEYFPLTGQGKLRNRKIISERKQTFYGNSLPVWQTDKESIFVRLDIFLSANPTKPTLFRNSDIPCIPHKNNCKKKIGSHNMKRTDSSIIIVRNVCVLTSASMIVYLFFARS